MVGIPPRILSLVMIMKEYGSCGREEEQPDGGSDQPLEAHPPIHNRLFLHAVAACLLLLLPQRHHSLLSSPHVRASSQDEHLCTSPPGACTAHQATVFLLEQDRSAWCSQAAERTASLEGPVTCTSCVGCKQTREWMNACPPGDEAPNMSITSGLVLSLHGGPASAVSIAGGPERSFHVASI
jgi:hypothetical protein